ncbi:uncharacterized protein RCC_10215 [Ramularia collo-cygni]|uniref:Trafficking protein particle complex II-specific subunit 65 IgD3 domain-containing protein n=1 Tax=Ramularia collo-cygni TaxID=112498 RepID=A0A2D3VBX3_9PEZI|nr:uncharacterized protein RCC_10215 [Ramularia collo-cygni]CZT24490.1 uncharacterized protein RCC_10215 [Ramularia collo-cygni]
MTDSRSRFEALSPAHLEVHLPKAQDLDVGTLLRVGGFEELARAPGRRNLFFDEEANILVVLKTGHNETDVRQNLSSLELILSAHATDAVPQGAGNAASASGKHDLVSKSFSATSFSDVVSIGDNAYVIWKPSLPLPRPRARLQRPAIYFTATLKMDSSKSDGSRRIDKEYLTSYEPLPENILEPFQHDRVLGNSDVYLSETRITKIAPKPLNVESDVKPIRGASKRAYPAVPALFTKLRYSTLPDATIASLHVETSHLIAGTVQITEVDLSVQDLLVEEITSLTLPLQTRGGDETIFLYKITSKGNAASPTTNPQVKVSIKADAALDQGSHIDLNVDLQTDAEIPTHNSHPSYAWSRPLKTSSHHKSLSVQSMGRPTSTDGGSRKADSGAAGVIFTFACPATTQKNEEFKMSVKCLNQSDRQRRFAVVTLQPRKPLTGLQPDNDTESDLIAKIFNAPPLARIKTPDVLDLNPDLRIGPLPAGACFETHLSFRAMTSGLLDFGTLRIIDLDTRQSVDVRELPDVVALEAS